MGVGVVDVVAASSLALVCSAARAWIARSFITNLKIAVQERVGSSGKGGRAWEADAAASEEEERERTS